jgi:tetratricopeptide (TPR) repeat protein
VAKSKTSPKPAAKPATKQAAKPAPKPGPKAPRAEAKPKPATSSSSVSTKAIGYASTGTKAYNSGDYEGALAAFKLCLKVAPTYGNCLLGIGVAYEKLSNFAKAKENFVKFLKYAPEHKHAELVKRKLQRIESR